MMWFLFLTAIRLQNIWLPWHSMEYGFVNANVMNIVPRNNVSLLKIYPTDKGPRIFQTSVIERTIWRTNPDLWFPREPVLRNTYNCILQKFVCREKSILSVTGWYIIFSTSNFKKIKKSLMNFVFERLIYCPTCITFMTTNFLLWVTVMGLWSTCNFHMV